MKKRFMIITVSVLSVSALIALLILGVNKWRPSKGSDGENTDVEVDKNFELEYDAAADFYSVIKYIGEGRDVILPTKYKGKNVIAIGEEAFADTDIDSVFIHEKIYSIADRAFTRSTVKTVEFEANCCLVQIGKEAFSYCSSLESVFVPDNVTTLSEGIFRDCKSLKNAVLPKAVNEICPYAFNGCESLSNVHFPSSLELIGENAFGGCNFSDIAANAGLKRIDKGAFENCVGVESIYISETVEKIDETAFKNCSSVRKIEVEKDNKKFAVYGNCLIDLDTKTLIKGCGNSKILLRGEDIRKIGAYAFYNCDDLTSIFIPDNISKIGEYAFYGCDGLEKVSFSDANRIYAMSKYAFADCKQLKTVILPPRLKEIGDFAFSGCSALEACDLPQTVFAIGKNSFGGCASLSKLVIPSALVKLNMESFWGCTGIKEIEAGNDSARYRVIDNCLVDTQNDLLLLGTDGAVIPNIVLSIGDYAFFGKTLSREFIIPDSVTSIGISAFEGSKGVVSIYFSNSLADIGDKAFSRCKELEDINLPPTLKSIGKQAFSECDSLRKVVMSGGGLNTIPEGCFSHCSALNEVALADSIVTISAAAFLGCGSLENITLSNSLTYIAEDSFTGCTGVRYNEYLGALYLGNKNNPYIALMAVKDRNAGNFGIEGRTRIIAPMAFNSCHDLKAIFIPSNVHTVSRKAFFDCSGMLTVMISEGVKILEEGSFDGCMSLTHVVIPQSITGEISKAFPNGVETVIKK